MLNLEDNSITSALWPNTEHLLSSDVLRKIRFFSTSSDETGKINSQVIDALKQERYFGIAVPRDFEGRGANILECCAIQRRLGFEDAGLAVGLNMHLFTVGVIYESWKRNKDTSWALLEAIATQNRVVASAFGEPKLGGSILRSNCIAKKVDGGYVVSGLKAPCSIAKISDLVCLQLETDEEREDRLLVALIPTTSNGLEIIENWDSLGMRSSESDAIKMDECYIPSELVFHRCVPGQDNDSVFAASMCWFALSATATYIGIANAALMETRRALEFGALDKLDATRASLPSFQSELGELVSKLLTLEAATVGLCRAVMDDDSDLCSLMVASLGLKTSSIEAFTSISMKAMELTGGGSYSRTSKLSRILRDTLAVQFHPPTRYASKQILGRWWLDRPFTFELWEAERSLDLDGGEGTVFSE